MLKARIASSLVAGSLLLLGAAAVHSAEFDSEIAGAAAAASQALHAVQPPAQPQQPPTRADASAPAADRPSLPQQALETVREWQRGLASWYGRQFHGKRTASGEVYDMNDLTAAHPSLPFGTVVRVRSLENDRSVEVRINDRGPFVGRRIIDLSRGAAEALGLIDAGTGTKNVAIDILSPVDGNLPPPKRARRSAR